jgi:RNA polymerase sigma factor (sigma-70 family)
VYTHGGIAPVLGREKRQVRRSSSMVQADSSLTSPTLLGQVRDWGDHPAWSAFYERYNPLLRIWCHGFALGSDDSDELCQRVWIELMTRMRTFRYDPGRGFRRWLWRLFRSRAIDLLRARRATRGHSVAELALPESLPMRPGWGTSDGNEVDAPEEVSLTLLSAASAAQEEVRSRVDAETWRGYWLIAIEDWTVREAANSLGKRYTAVYNGYRRVERMLRLEGQRRLADFKNQTPGSTELEESCSGP